MTTKEMLVRHIEALSDEDAAELLDQLQARASSAERDAERGFVEHLAAIGLIRW